MKLGNKKQNWRIQGLVRECRILESKSRKEAGVLGVWVMVKENSDLHSKSIIKTSKSITMCKTHRRCQFKIGSKN